MSNQTKHTPEHSQAMEDFFDPKLPKMYAPTPWEIGEAYGTPAKIVLKQRNGAQVFIALIGNVNVSDDAIQANADFIVTACNAHEDLLEALKECISDLACYEVNPKYPGKNSTLITARAAIAKARGL